MTFKTILLHLNDFNKVPANAKFTAQLANQFDAHLIGLVTERFPSVTDPDIDIQHEIVNVTLKAGQFEVFCEKHGVASFESQIVPNDPIKSIIQQARCSDLLVLNQPYAHSNVKPDRLVVESVLLDSGKPCLFIPYAGAFEHIGKNIMLAWDGSREAARATAEAMPILMAADSVELVIINGKTGYNGDSEAMVDTGIAKYLARHDVNVEVKEIKSKIDVGNTLLSHAADSGADLCVMGAYGQSRVKEWIWGGATRTVLETMTLPVFMSH